ITAGKFDEVPAAADRALAGLNEKGIEQGRRAAMEKRLLPLRRTALEERGQLARKSLEDLLAKHEYVRVPAAAEKFLLALEGEAILVGSDGELSGSFREIRKRALRERGTLALRSLEELVAKKEYARVPATAEKTWLALQGEAALVGIHGELSGSFREIRKRA